MGGRSRASPAFVSCISVLGGTPAPSIPCRAARRSPSAAPGACGGRGHPAWIDDPDQRCRGRLTGGWWRLKEPIP
jgi:hypothetical protein